MAAPHSERTCVIIGGGPAGLACALYLARFNRQPRVVFREDQRARWIARIWNLPGYSEGPSGDELITRCQAHARQHGAQLVHGEAVALSGTEGDFQVRLRDGQLLRACHLVLATGVEDRPPAIPRVDKYIGHGLRHCSICDGYEARGLRLAIFGKGDSLARHALFMTAWTERITLLFNGEGRWTEIQPRLREELERRGIRGLEPRVVEVFDEGRAIRGFRLADGTTLDVDRAYSALPLRPRTELARQLGVRVDGEGFIRVDTYGRTSVPGVYAVGDVVNADYAQIVIGMGQAAVAAINIQQQHAPGS